MKNKHFSFGDLGELQNYSIEDVISHLQKERNRQIQALEASLKELSSAASTGTELRLHFSRSTSSVAEMHNAMLVANRLRDHGMSFLNLSTNRSLCAQLLEIGKSEGIRIGGFESNFARSSKDGAEPAP